MSVQVLPHPLLRGEGGKIAQKKKVTSGNGDGDPREGGGWGYSCPVYGQSTLKLA